MVCEENLYSQHYGLNSLPPKYALSRCYISSYLGITEPGLRLTTCDANVGC